MEDDLMVSGRIYFYLGSSPERRIVGEGCPQKGYASKQAGIEAEFGISYCSVKGTEGDDTNLRVPDLYPNAAAPAAPYNHAFAVDVTARMFDGMEWQLEYIFKGERNDGNLSLPVIPYAGVKAQIMYALSPVFGEIGFSLSQFDPDGNIDNNEINEYRLGWNKYLGGLGHANKLSLNFIQTNTAISVTQTKVEREVKMQWQINL